MKIIPLNYQRHLSQYLAAFSQLPYPLLLDSCRDQQNYQGKLQRFDMLMAQPDEVLIVQDQHHWQHLVRNGDGYQESANTNADLLAKLDQMNLAAEQTDVELPFSGGLAGAISYDLGAQRAGIKTKETSQPVAVIGQYRWAIISDHDKQQSYLVSHSHNQQDCQAILALLDQVNAGVASPSVLEDIHPPSDYQHKFAQVQEYIRAGDCYQINLTRCFKGAYQSNAVSDYLHLREISPTPFAGFFDAQSFQLLSLSPERFIRCQNKQLETRPIKGTIARGANAEADEQNKRQLAASAKDRSENLMIVDLLRNDLGRYAKTGSVKVPEIFAIESYTNVHHMVSSITAELNDDISPIAALIAASPGGSITGAPKIRAMEIIEELEDYSREYYCGSLFYADCNGQLDSSILIRTLMVADGHISAYAGGGIVADSQCESEWQESNTKINNLLKHLAAIT